MQCLTKFPANFEEIEGAVTQQEVPFSAHIETMCASEKQNKKAKKTKLANM